MLLKYHISPGLGVRSVLGGYMKNPNHSSQCPRVHLVNSPWVKDINRLQLGFFGFEKRN